MPQDMVFVVDDDSSVRTALSRLIRSAGLSVTTFSNAQEFLSFCPPDGPSCLVLDVRLPGLNGLELQQVLQQASREIPIIFITGHADVPMSVRAMKAGALDFLEKPFDDQDLLASIERALATDKRARSESKQRERMKQRLKRLTPREREVLKLVVRGLANKVIAAELGISEKTVKVHRGRVMEKMQALSLPDLVRIAEKLDISD